MQVSLRVVSVGLVTHGGRCSRDGVQRLEGFRAVLGGCQDRVMMCAVDFKCVMNTGLRNSSL